MIKTQVHRYKVEVESLCFPNLLGRELDEGDVGERVGEVVVHHVVEIEKKRVARHGRHQRKRVRHVDCFAEHGTTCMVFLNC